MTNETDRYALAAMAAAAAAADRARAEATQGQRLQGGTGLQSPMHKLSKIPGAHWLRTHWIGVAAAVVVLPLFGVVAWVRNSEAEYSATAQQGALFGHPSAWLPEWLGGHPRSASLITNDKQYAALVHDYPDLALNSKDPPEIRTAKIGAINAHWKAKLQAEQDAATMMEKAKITADAQAQVDTYVTQPALARARTEAVEADYDTHIRVTGSTETQKQLTFYGVATVTSPPDTVSTMYLSNSQYANDTNPFELALHSTPETIPAHKKIMPLFSEQGSLISYKNFVAIWDGDEWGLVPLDQYRASHLPEKDDAQ